MLFLSNMEMEMFIFIAIIFYALIHGVSKINKISVNFEFRKASMI